MRISRRAATRTSKAKGRTKGMAFMTRPRLPISQRFGPSVPKVLEHIGEFARGQTLQAFAGRLSMEIERQIDVLLKQQRTEAGVAPF